MESGIVNLKAELFKKRAGITQNNIYKNNSLKSLKIKGIDNEKAYTKIKIKKTKKVKKSELDAEESAKLAKSKTILEMKAKLYDKLKNGVEVLEDDDLNQKFLVDFQKKITADIDNEKSNQINEISDKTSQEVNDPADFEEGDWVEYTDEFGRSRVCLKSDLPSSVKDGSIAKDSAKERMAEYHEIWNKIDEESQRKDNIHYEDILYDEARDHGVSFMPFSRDSTERNAQHEYLQKLRTETKAATSAKEIEDKKRKKAMAQRLAKVRDRKRLKAGLPMLETEEDRLKTPPLSEDEGEEEVVAVEDIPIPVSVEVETPKEKKPPPPPVRDWDLGKPGTSRVLTQEQWMESRRTIRENDFAPPTAYKASKFQGFRPANDNKYGYQNQSRQREQSESSEDHCQSSREVPISKNQDFAPPSTYEYFGPNNKYYNNKVKNDSLSRAISKGLSNLRNNTS